MVITKQILKKVLRKSELKGLDTDEFTTSQHFYESKDGTKIPMFIMHKKVCFIITVLCLSCIHQSLFVYKTGNLFI